MWTRWACEPGALAPGFRSTYKHLRINTRALAHQATPVPALFRRCLLLAWLGLAPILSAAQAVDSEQPPMVVQQVSAHGYFVQGLSQLGSGANQNFISNAGFVVTPGGVVVVDALGSPHAA